MNTPRQTYSCRPHNSPHPPCMLEWSPSPLQACINYSPGNIKGETKDNLKCATFPTSLSFAFNHHSSFKPICIYIFFNFCVLQMIIWTPVKKIGTGAPFTDLKSLETKHSFRLSLQFARQREQCSLFVRIVFGYSGFTSQLFGPEKSFKMAVRSREMFCLGKE